MKVWPEFLSLRPSNEKYYLLGIFFILVAIKSVLTFFSYTPIIFIDEGLYDTIAQYIVKGTFFSAANNWTAFPSGYSFFLSIGYLFSGDKTIIYHVMLIINSVLSSSILFPSYFILKKYLSQQQAILGSLLISVLPAVTLFTFILMSENLFIPLTMFSIWFLLESFENNYILWDFLAAISVFYLYFTRETGVVFIVAVCVALAFFILSAGPRERLKVIKDKAVLICALAIPLLLWILYKIIMISSASYYGVGGLIDTLINAFSSPVLFERFSLLMLHEIEYLIFSGYVIIFIISLLFVTGCLFRLRFFGLQGFLHHFSQKKVLALKSVILYCLTFSAGLLVISVVFLQSWGLPSIYGRYIEPVVPALFLFGIIGIGSLSAKCAGQKWTSGLLFCLGVPVLFLSVYSLPDTFTDFFPNDFGIYYIIHLQNLIKNSLLMVLLLAVVLVFIPCYLLRNSQKNFFPITFFSFFILLSVICSLPMYEIYTANMSGTERVNQIGRYLQEHSQTDTKILMDSDGTNWEKRYFRSLTQFWTPGEIILRSIGEDSSGVLTKEFVDKADYIISKKFLPYPCLIASNMDYKLYTLHATGQSVQYLSLPSVIDIGNNATSCMINGFYYPEGAFRWTSDFSAVKIEYPKENGPFMLHISTGGYRPENSPANVTFIMNGHFIGAMEKSGGTEIYSVVIPGYYLEGEYQILGIRTNTWKPSDYGTSDSRNLGIAVDWIRLDEIFFDGMHNVEYWNSVPTRWMADNATLLIYADENRIANVTFRAISLSQPRTLEIFSGDALQTTLWINPVDFTDVSVQFPLQMGENNLRLHIPGGCDRPMDFSELNSTDHRCLSIAVQNVTIS